VAQPEHGRVPEQQHEHSRLRDRRDEAVPA
jgi:hypothetical protein